MDKPKKKGAEKQEKIAELTDTLQRLQAEFENYKKRVDKEKLEFMQFAKAELVEKLLPVIDSFEVAIRNTSNHENFMKGVELIYSQLYGLLEKEGLEPIDAAGKKLDPYLHEVLLTEDSDKEDVVLEELQKGYMLNGRVIRHSKVKIGRKREEEKNDDSKADAKG